MPDVGDFKTKCMGVHASIICFAATGASFLYNASTQPFWEAMEVRAFGLLLQGLLERRSSSCCTALQTEQSQRQQDAATVLPLAESLSKPTSTTRIEDASERVWQTLEGIAAACCLEVPASRPKFSFVEKECNAMLKIVQTVPLVGVSN